MKIAFLNIYNGLVDRGAETFVKEVAQRLSKNNKVVVYQAGNRQGFERYKVEKIDVGMDWKKKDCTGKLIRRFFIDYWSFKILVFTLKSIPKIFKEKFDVVIPVNGGWQPALIRIVTWLYRGKMVISGQSGMGWDDINNLWSFPNTFVALSSYASNWARGMNHFVWVEVIPNGVDTNKFTPEGKKISTKLPKPIVLSVGALNKGKRIELAVKAVARLKNVSLLVCGDGEKKEEIEKLGNKLLKNRFELIKLPFEKMPEVYRVADVFTLPSEYFHSFEIVLVEAMATNLPLVANNDPIREEIVGDAGILVNPTNSKEYAAAIKEALQKDWDEKPLKQSKKFDWDEIAEKYNNLFNTLK